MDAYIFGNIIGRITMKWFKGKKLMNKSTTESSQPTTTVTNVIQSSMASGANVANPGNSIMSTAGYSSTFTTGITTPGPLYPGTQGSTYNFINTSYKPSHVFQLSNSSKEIVRMDLDGSIIWANDINIDEASEAFAKSMRLGAELCAGITKNVKLSMRDSVFSDLISIAKDKGSLTAEDLTYLLEASKIIEKLKGGNE